MICPYKLSQEWLKCERPSFLDSFKFHRTIKWQRLAIQPCGDWTKDEQRLVQPQLLLIIRSYESSHGCSLPSRHWKVFPTAGTRGDPLMVLEFDWDDVILFLLRRREKSSREKSAYKFSAWWRGQLMIYRTSRHMQDCIRERWAERYAVDASGDIYSAKAPNQSANAKPIDRKV